MQRKKLIIYLYKAIFRPHLKYCMHPLSPSLHLLSPSLHPLSPSLHPLFPLSPPSLPLSALCPPLPNLFISLPFIQIPLPPSLYINVNIKSSLSHPFLLYHLFIPSLIRPTLRVVSHFNCVALPVSLFPLCPPSPHTDRPSLSLGKMTRRRAMLSLCQL